MMLSIRSVAAHSALARRLAVDLGAVLLDPDEVAATTYLLDLGPAAMTLSRVDAPAVKPFCVRLDSRAAARGRDPLLRALGKGVSSVYDLTAGWCVDAATMAIHGIRVTAFEHHPLVFHMVQFAWQRCDRQAIRDNLTLRYEDGAQCGALSTVPDVVYLDPMYPPRTGAAASPRAISLLRAVVRDCAGPDGADENRLLDVAGAVAAKRVVVKRPRHAPPLTAAGKVGEVQSKQLRFDIYAPRSDVRY